MSLRYKLNGPLNAIDLNPTQDHCVVAGREVLKILDLTGEDGNNPIVESINLRVGYRLNLNFSSNDVNWGNGYSKEKIATAATNGTIVLWDLNKPGQKIERLITEHTRAVNKIKFNKNNGSILISASQDGLIKLWDIRNKNSSMYTIMGKSESVRDVQFNPSNPDLLVAAFENGSIQTWDLRNTSTPLRKFNGHYGLALTVDWHPDGKLIASGGRDKLIKVWNFQSESRNPQLILQTSQSVGVVKFRPLTIYNKVGYLASSALLNDGRIQLWDLDRPQIPSKWLMGHDNVTTGFVWSDPDLLWSCSKDRYLMQHNLQTENSIIQPIDHLTVNTLAWSPYCEMIGIGTTPLTTQKSLSVLQKSKKLLGQREFDYFPSKQGIASLQVPTMDTTAFRFMAEYYYLNPDDVETSCLHNAQVANHCNKPRIAQTWHILHLLLPKSTPLLSHQSPIGANSATPHTNPTPLEGDIGTGDDINADEWLKGLTILAQESLVLTSDKSTQQNLSQSQSNNNNINQAKLNQISNSSSRDELNLPEDFEQLGISKDPFNTSGILDPNQLLKIQQQQLLQQQNQQLTTIPPINTFLPPPIDFFSVLKEALQYYSNEGDIQTSVALYSVFSQTLENLPNSPFQQEFESWTWSYLEMLRRFRLWLPLANLISTSGVNEVRSKNQQSTTVYTTCNNCFKPIMGSESAPAAQTLDPSSGTGVGGGGGGFWGCEKCSKMVNPCSICHQLVKGLYTWCQGCGHGGHLACYQNWDNSSDILHNHQQGSFDCPAGCGHLCKVN